GNDEGWVQVSTTLGAMITCGFSRIEYVYVFGDDWTHRLELSAAGSAAAGVAYPRLIAGARACPLEDSGGPRGHERLLRALGGDLQPDGYDEEDTQQLLVWAGDFDPQAFDAADAQARLDMTFGNGPARAGGWGDWPEPFRLGERRGPARAHEAAASLTRDLPAERFDNALFITGAAQMLRMLAEEPAPATKTGALSIKSVLRLCDAIGIELREPSLVRSEAEIPWNETLHMVLDMAGIVRRRGRVIALTPRGMLLSDPVRRAELAATLLRTRFQEVNLAYGTPGGSAPRLQGQYLETLSRLRDVARDWVSVTDVWRDAISDAAKAECVRAYPYEPPYLVEVRLLQPFVEMGLLESAGAHGPDGEHRYRCAPLLDDWVHFDDESPAESTFPALALVADRLTIRTALEEFLAASAPDLPTRMVSAYRSNAESLAHYLGSYGPNDPSPAETAQWEALGDDDDGTRFCDVFGPEHIAPAIGMYLTWFLPKKVGISEDGARKATRFATDLLGWLHLKGIVSANDLEIPLEHAQAARSSLPAAARFERVIREWCDSAPVADDGDMIEDRFEIVKVDANSLWLTSYMTGEEFGPSPVPGKVIKVARAGMIFSGAIVPLRGVWRIAEVWTVYPK
ncbi:MAG: plasmid pRiA4b ORF-3 family protein, partial [Coriobacteriia bacterium]|nr:plasmid pRiA4b ORF-3 family protein [Coriobacteriia bacterium]